MSQALGIQVLSDGQDDLSLQQQLDKTNAIQQTSDTVKAQASNTDNTTNAQRKAKKTATTSDQIAQLVVQLGQKVDQAVKRVESKQDDLTDYQNEMLYANYLQAKQNQLMLLQNQQMLQAIKTKK